MVKKDPFQIAWTIILLILALIGIYFLILKLTGHSPTDVSILYTLVALIFGGLFKMNYELGKFNEFSKNTKNSFSQVREDNQEMKTELRKLQEQMTRLERKFP